MSGLKDKTVMITGAAHPKGIGFKIAETFANKGYKVIITDIDSRILEQSKQLLLQHTDQISAYEFDAANEAEVNHAVDKISTEVGQIDILINNVGGTSRITREEISSTHDELRSKSFLGVTTVDTLEWYRILNVNLNSAFYCSRKVLPGMIERRFGRIINISSVTGRQGINKIEGYSSGPYAVAKAALIGLTKQLALEVGEYGINVNSIAPGIILTTRGEKVKKHLDSDTYNQLLNRIPLKRFGEPEEIAGIAYSLCTDDFQYVTGQTIDANGGLYFS